MLFFLASCATEQERFRWEEMEVTVSAFNSVASQTDGSPAIAAWGDTLIPGMRCVAVSRDLVALGLGHNVHIKIEGADHVYLVKDKMHHRWKKRVDLYMGTDVDKAREWGKKKLKIRYRVANDSLAETGK